MQQIMALAAIAFAMTGFGIAVVEIVSMEMAHRRRVRERLRQITG